MNPPVSTLSCDLHVHLLTSLPSLQDAIVSASEGFGQPIDRSLSQDVDEHLKAAEFGFQFVSQSETAGFALFTMHDDLLWGLGMMIRPHWQKSGLVREGIQLAQRMTQARYLALRTQSPRMWSAGQHITRVWTPTPELGFEHPELDVVRHRAAKLKGITPTVTRAVFDRPLYGQKPTHLDPTIQTWWDGMCDFDAGDMVLCVGAFSPKRRNHV